MDKGTENKIARLLHETRVMTLAVSNQDIPWSSPVYFVFHDSKFYFFSNDQSKHILYAADGKNMAVSIFHDADQMEQIYGCQMIGWLDGVSKMSLYLVIVQKYITKFSFLRQVFGSQLIENKQFFLEKFKSRLYCFTPESIFLSDNSKPSGKRIQIDINRVSGCQTAS